MTFAFATKHERNSSRDHVVTCHVSRVGHGRVRSRSAPNAVHATTWPHAGTGLTWWGNKWGIPL
jgi:hypothetical protein